MKSRASWAKLALGSFIIIVIGCGKIADLTEVPELETVHVDSSIPIKSVKGNAYFGSQCPYGTISEQVPIKMDLQECPIPLDSVELTELPSTFLIQADCKKKIFTVRTADRKLDSAWEILPDGSFFFTVEPGIAKLRTDGADHQDCIMDFAMDISGKLNCTDRDKLTIPLEINWWPDKTNHLPTPTVSPSPSPTPSYTPIPTPTPTATPRPILNPSPQPSPTPTTSPRPSIPGPSFFSFSLPFWPFAPAPTPSPLPSPQYSSPTPSPTRHRLPNECELPSSCFFHAVVQMQQCQ